MGFGVPQVDISYECAPDIFGWSPIVLLDAIPLPIYKVFEFPSENSAIQDAFYFIFFDSIMDYGGWWVALYSFGDGVCLVGPL